MPITKRVIPAQEIEDEAVGLSIGKEPGGLVLTASCQPKGLAGPALPGQRQAYTVRLDQVPDISITVGGKAVPIATLLAANVELAEAIINHVRAAAAAKTQEPQA